MAVKAVKSGMIIIGGGVIKHHVCNANLMVSYKISYNNFCFINSDTADILHMNLLSVLNENIFREMVRIMLCT